MRLARRIRMNTLPHLGTEERAVYHLVETGHITPQTSGLYRSALRRLEAHGLIRKCDDGGYAAVYAKGDPQRRTVAPSSPPPAMPEAPEHEAMVTLVVRVPPAMRAALEGRGPNLSEATRAVIERGLRGSGVMRRAAG